MRKNGKPVRSYASITPAEKEAVKMWSSVNLHQKQIAREMKLSPYLIRKIQKELCLLPPHTEPFSPELERKVLARLRAGRSVHGIARELGCRGTS
jgi:DNA-binding NarL/FixJ family response regulator